MRQFKIRKGRQYKTFEITNGNYNNALPIDENERKKYSISTPEGMRQIAICPSCENPIRLFGLVKPIERTSATGKKTLVRAYGKHLEKDTEIADHDQMKYKYCPLASDYRSSNKEDKYDKPTDMNKEIYYSIRENFDTAIYILSQSLGVWIDDKTARRILEKYLGFQGYMHVDSHYHNIPWMLFYLSSGVINLWGARVIADSELYKYLSKQKNVKLIPEMRKNGKATDYRVVENGSFLRASIAFGTKKVTIDDEGNIKEVYYLDYSSNTWDRETVEKIEIDNDWYNRTVFSTRRSRNKRLLAIAEEMMPDLE